VRGKKFTGEKEKQLSSVVVKTWERPRLKKRAPNWKIQRKSGKLHPVIECPTAPGEREEVASDGHEGIGDIAKITRGKGAGASCFHGKGVTTA